MVSERMKATTTGVMSVELALQREMAYRQKMEKLETELLQQFNSSEKDYTPPMSPPVTDAANHIRAMESQTVPSTVPIQGVDHAQQPSQQDIPLHDPPPSAVDAHGSQPPSAGNYSGGLSSWTQVKHASSARGAPPLARKGRGKGRDITLYNEWLRNSKRKFHIEFAVQDGTYYPVGEYGTKFVHRVGNVIGGEIPPCYKSWANVPQQEKAKIMPMIEKFFDLDEWRQRRDWGLVSIGLERLFQDKYRGRKNLVKRQWEKTPGWKPDEFDDATWQRCKDFWESPEEKAKSEKNKANRAKQTVPSLHGSRSISMYRHLKADPQTQQAYSELETYREMHQRNGVWVSHESREKYNEMVRRKDELLSQSRATTGIRESPSSADPSPAQSTPAIINEAEIMESVLGPRRGHKKGVGRIVKGPSSSSRASIVDFFTRTPPPPATQDLIK